MTKQELIERVQNTLRVVKKVDESIIDVDTAKSMLNNAINTNPSQQTLQLDE